MNSLGVAYPQVNQTASVTKLVAVKKIVTIALGWFHENIEGGLTDISF